jgi:Glycosyl transferase family 11
MMAISYNYLGSNGRLGNQMFQYAGLRGIAAHRGYDWLIPEPKSYGNSNYGLFDCFEMGSVKSENFGKLDTQTIASGVFDFNREFFDNCPDNVNLHDYFQTQKYFLNIEDSIRSDFTFKKEILDPCKELVSELNNPIFIHVRRGDYVNHQYAHPLCSIDYYEEALTHFDESSPVLVFSDDIEWCKQQPFFSDDRFMISEYRETYSQTSETKDGRIKSLIPYFDLCMMSLCSGGIVANSSMSWWGAWLISNPTQPIVAPKIWFNSEYIESNNYNMEDLLPESWIEV